MAVALTADLGRFVAELRYQDIPKPAIAFVHTGFTDCVGTMIAGANQEAPQLLKAMLAPAGNEATLLFGAGRASVLDAAWINGTAAHALDFDDVALRGHPSVVLVPAILAEAETVCASGTQMVTAYAAGYEVMAELVRRDPDNQQKKGWHPTGIFGSIGAAAACASLRQLNAEQSACAIALGASQSAGLVANMGTMTKPLHAGRSAHAGVAAARLAASGFTAALDALEHTPGFLDAVSVAGKIDLASPIEVGIHWKLARDGLTLKKYPLCFASHWALDLVFDLLAKHEIEISKVSGVSVAINRRHAMVLRNHAPQNAMEAKFSMEFAMACAFIARRAGYDELTDDFVRSAEVQAFMRRIAVIPDDEDPARPGHSMNDGVTITTTDGRRIKSERQAQMRGSPDLPLTREELWMKFAGCVRFGQSRVSARELFDKLMSLDQLERVQDLPGLLSGSRLPTP